MVPAFKEVEPGVSFSCVEDTVENGQGHWGEMDSDKTHGHRGVAMV